jgi:hypothetical protein
MTIVMGLDQHRAQVTAEWVDTETGELSRARVAPAHRSSVRKLAFGVLSSFVLAGVFVRAGAVVGCGRLCASWVCCVSGKRHAVA